mmetsp:Transcript_17042/g.29142  ORF Transcript_17042/g.29142 Transcript_17042/m.29142 type:complete len:324 (-) Transcript_17042:14-985(-)
MWASRCNGTHALLSQSCFPAHASGDPTPVFVTVCVTACASQPKAQSSHHSIRILEVAQNHTAPLTAWWTTCTQLLCTVDAGGHTNGHCSGIQCCQNIHRRVAHMKAGSPSISSTCYCGLPFFGRNTNHLRPVPPGLVCIARANITAKPPEPWLGEERLDTQGFHLRQSNGLQVASDKAGAHTGLMGLQPLQQSPHARQNLKAFCGLGCICQVMLVHGVLALGQFEHGLLLGYPMMSHHLNHNQGVCTPMMLNDIDVRVRVKDLLEAGCESRFVQLICMHTHAMDEGTVHIERNKHRSSTGSSMILGHRNSCQVLFWPASGRVE